MSLKYPFRLEVIKDFEKISFTSQVTFFVGENGTGKSTLAEAIAYHAGFGLEGGNKNINLQNLSQERSVGIKKFADGLSLSWRLKPSYGYFFRSENFVDIATKIDELSQVDRKAYESYGGKSLHEQSHGESFLSFFKYSLSHNSFYILDEPEAALSPQRQLALLSIINELCNNSDAQFIIVTHSPILLAYPGAVIYSFDDGQIEKIAYEDTSHYKITKDFLNNPSIFLKHLLL